MGPTGPTGCPGPSALESYVQLFDRKYANDLTCLAPLNLSNEGINPLYTSGGYRLTTTKVKNDTLVLPGSGVYHLEVSLRTCFTLPCRMPPCGSTYQIGFNILNEANVALYNLNYTGIIPKDTDSVLSTQLSVDMLIHPISPCPNLKIVLSNFNFNIACEHKLRVYDIIVVVQKLSEGCVPDCGAAN